MSKQSKVVETGKRIDLMDASEVATHRAERLFLFLTFKEAIRQSSPNEANTEANTEADTVQRGSLFSAGKSVVQVLAKSAYCSYIG